MHKRLYRSGSNRILGGVLGGIGDYFDVDPTVIRIIFIILTLASLFFPCIIGYFLAYLIMPEERVWADWLENGWRTGWLIVWLTWSFLWPWLVICIPWFIYQESAPRSARAWYFRCLIYLSGRFFWFFRCRLHFWHLDFLFLWSMLWCFFWLPKLWNLIFNWKDSVARWLSQLLCQSVRWSFKRWLSNPCGAAKLCSSGYMISADYRTVMPRLHSCEEPIKRSLSEYRKMIRFE